jgi:integrase
MASHSSDRPVSALRARMIEDMTVRGFNEQTRSNYIRDVRAFAAFIGRSPDTATAEDLRRFQLHQTQSGVQPPSINSAVSALRFFFTVTLDRADLARRLTVVRQPRRLPVVLSVQEVTLLLQAAPGSKHKAAFATAGACPRAGRRPDPWGAGLRVSEVVALKVGDIDSERMLLRIERGKSLPSRKRGAARACPRESGGPLRHAVAAAARTAARLVAGGPAARRAAAARLAVSRPQSDRATLDPPVQPRRSCRSRGRRDQEAGVAAYAAAQLCYAPAGTGHRYSRHPEPAPAKAGVLLGHAKLDTTARYTRVANTTIRSVTSPLDRLAPLTEGRPRPGV